MNPLAALAALAVIGALFMSRRANAASDAFPDLTRSATAARLGIDNRIPQEFIDSGRAAGLQFCFDVLTADGLRVTSGFRTRELTGAIREGLKPGETVKTLPGPGSHEQCRALDTGAIRKSARDSAGNAVASASDLLDTEARIRSIPELDGLISKIIREGAFTRNAHCHIQFIGAELESLALRLEENRA